MQHVRISKRDKLDVDNREVPLHIVLKYIKKIINNMRHECLFGGLGFAID